MPEYITHFFKLYKKKKKKKGTCFTWKEFSLTLSGTISSHSLTVTEGTWLLGTYG